MKKMFDWFEVSRTNPDAALPSERLATLPELLRRATLPDYMSEFGGLPLRPEPQKVRLVKKLHHLRNLFTHFRPSGWSIEVAGLPTIIDNAVEIGRLLLLGHPACTFRLNQSQLELLTKQFEAATDILEPLGASRRPVRVPATRHPVRP